MLLEYCASSIHFFAPCHAFCRLLPRSWRCIEWKRFIVTIPWRISCTKESTVFAFNLDTVSLEILISMLLIRLREAFAETCCCLSSLDLAIFVHICRTMKSYKKKDNWIQLYSFSWIVEIGILAYKYVEGPSNIRGYVRRFPSSVNICLYKKERCSPSTQLSFILALVFNKSKRNQGTKTKGGV